MDNETKKLIDKFATVAVEMYTDYFMPKLDTLRKANEVWRNKHSMIQNDLADAWAKLAEVKAERDAFQSTLNGCQAESEKIEAERDKLKGALEKLDPCPICGWSAKRELEASDE